MQTSETRCQVLLKAPVVGCLHSFLTELRLGAQLSGTFLSCLVILSLPLFCLSAGFWFVPTSSLAVGTWLILLLKTLKEPAGVRKRAGIHVGVCHAGGCQHMRTHRVQKNILVQFLLVGDGGSAIPHIIACSMQTSASSQHSWRMIKEREGQISGSTYWCENEKKCNLWPLEIWLLEHIVYQTWSLFRLQLTS